MGEGGITPELAQDQQAKGPHPTESNVDAKPAGAISLGRKVRDIDAQLEETKAKGDKEKVNEFFSTSNATNDLFSVNHPEIVGEEGFKDGVTKINIQGQNRALLDVRLDTNNKAVYLCRVDGIDGYIEVQREVVRNILLIEKKDSVLSLFSGDERKGVEDYIRGLTDGGIPLSTSWITEEIQEQNANQEKSPEDKVISDQLERLEQKLKKTGQLTDREKGLLRVLRIAEKSTSEARSVIQNHALQLLKTSGTLGLDEAFQSIKNKITAGMDYLRSQGLSDEDIETGLNMLGTEEAEKILSQLGEAFVGRELSAKEINELVATEKKKGVKGGILLALLLAAIGPMELFKQTVPIGDGRN